MDRGRAYRTP